MHRLFEKGFQTLSLPFEWTLLKRAQLGEKEAFGKLYEFYVDRIYRFIFFKVRQEKEVAEDLTADVFVKAWEHLGTFKKGSFQTWLYTIARNRVIDYIRGVKQHVPLNEELVDAKETVEETVIKTLVKEEVLKCLDSLTDEQREVVVLRFVNDLSHREIAQIVGKREDAVRALQYRAIKEIKEKVEV
ncbi:MAG TPA: RNA polymerase sigma factor [Patescibacteria group bacterium]|nr:RNA polymerase sigma factor [Patescibacteria group bacterium]